MGAHAIKRAGYSSRDLLGALVSGLPSRKRNSRLFLMLQAHIDDSGWDGMSPVFVLAGYLAKKEQWDAFSDEWNSVLHPPTGRQLDVLKMSDAYRLDRTESRFFGWSEKERDDRLISFAKTINHHVMHG